MKLRKRIFAAAAIGAGCALVTGPVLAGDLFDGLGAVGSQELAAERGMAVEVDDEALAKAIGIQHQTVTINGDNGAAGTITMDTHTFANQVMSTNVINAGNNSVFQVQNVIAVTVVDSSISP